MPPYRFYIALTGFSLLGIGSMYLAYVFGDNKLFLAGMLLTPLCILTMALAYLDSYQGNNPALKKWSEVAKSILAFLGTIRVRR